MCALHPSPGRELDRWQMSFSPWATCSQGYWMSHPGHKIQCQVCEKCRKWQVVRGKWWLVSLCARGCWVKQMEGWGWEWTRRGKEEEERKNEKEEEEEEERKGEMLQSSQYLRHKWPGMEKIHKRLQAYTWKGIFERPSPNITETPQTKFLLSGFSSF